ncbi:unnamed protein product [Cylicocyclus nassatus]|uniref:C-type lectin domain-containing protein n=1 Tax=Cylicocyclus nassatus TaxID=53992 RepID=A0AA36DV61_CYLNA|nr:unnamed protein product [Cylicocyclus nassatus]
MGERKICRIFGKSYRAKSIFNLVKMPSCTSSSSFYWFHLNAFVDLNSTKQFSRGLERFRSLSYLSVSNAEKSARCESRWTLLAETDACYKTFFGETFDDAENMCKTLGAHLTSIHSFEENIFVADLAKMDRPGTTGIDFTWIGLHQANSRNWTWTDGTKSDFLPWAKDFPAGIGKCVLLISDVHARTGVWYHGWADEPCDSRLRTYVCKKMAIH